MRVVVVVDFTMCSMNNAIVDFTRTFLLSTGNSKRTKEKNESCAASNAAPKKSSSATASWWA